MSLADDVVGLSEHRNELQMLNVVSECGKNFNVWFSKKSQVLAVCLPFYSTFLHQTFRELGCLGKL